MTYVVFSPYWNIPESILRKETLPLVQKEPSYLERNHIEVVGTSGKAEPIDPTSIDWSDESAIQGVRFRQAPGDENALGLVKFIFPNHFNVYLHDTPNDKLFFKDVRALSHGCIRVEQPVKLAEYVMSDRADWTPERIEAAMHANEEKAVTLKEKLPVHIGYWTAWVEADGKTVTYTDDPYNIDKAQAGLIGRVKGSTEAAS
jgi:murein L,D-transpeptidase YcbB/YkuD